jgi:hypothetical protein
VRGTQYKVVLLKDLQIFEVSSDVEGQGSSVEFHNINELGEEGWELVNIVRVDYPVHDTLQVPGSNSLNTYAYFKRPLQRQAKFAGAPASKSRHRAVSALPEL